MSPNAGAGQVRRYRIIVLEPWTDLLETAADGQTVEDAKMVTAVALRFDTLRAEALPRRASRDRF